VRIAVLGNQQGRDLRADPLTAGLLADQAPQVVLVAALSNDGEIFSAAQLDSLHPIQHPLRAAIGLAGWSRWLDRARVTAATTKQAHGPSPSTKGYRGTSQGIRSPLPAQHQITGALLLAAGLLPLAGSSTPPCGRRSAALMSRR
jgi:hypothetical protein